MSVVCYCGEPTCPETEWDEGKCLTAPLRAEIIDLKARLRQVRYLTKYLLEDEFTEGWQELDRATDLRVKNWKDR